MTNDEFIEAICLPMEKWLDVVGYDGLYMVSSEGRIISLSREKVVRGNITTFTKPMLMRQNIRLSNGIPYYRVGLTDRNGKQSNKTVHRVVAMTFHPNPENYSDVDHINRNSLDNRSENLRWCTRKMNMANENTKKILAVCHKGVDRSYRWRAVVRLKDGIEIQRYRSITEATRDGFDSHNITQVCRGLKKTHRGYQWVYLDEYEKSTSSSNSRE